MDTKVARALAKKFLASIEPVIVVGEVAGAVRRSEPATPKIAIVVVPQPGSVAVRWGAPLAEQPATRLDEKLLDLIGQGKIAVDPRKKGTDPVIGPGFRKYIATQLNIAIELTIVRQEHYGHTLARLTGDGPFWASIASSFAKGGLMPEGWKISGGVLVNNALASVNCPTEAAFFAALGVNEVPPPAARTVNLARRLHRQVRKDRGDGEAQQQAGSVYTVDAEVDAGGKGRVGTAKPRTSWEDE